MFNDLSLGISSNERNFLDFGICGLLAFYAGIEAIAGARWLIGHGEKVWIGKFSRAIEIGEILRDIIVEMVPLDGVESGEIYMKGIVQVSHVLILPKELPIKLPPSKSNLKIKLLNLFFQFLI